MAMLIATAVAPAETASWRTNYYGSSQSGFFAFFAPLR
jgi:hypothetical protein